MLYNETRVVKEMDLFEVFCSSIALIEEELRNEDLDIPYLAKRLYISPYYFQRLFFAHTGKTVGSYIRERRLTEAGQEVKNGKSILETAFRYGYDSQESFTKSFRKFHGVTPGRAKRGCILSCCPKVNVQALHKGGISMDYTLEKENEFEIAVITRSFHPETANEEIEKFWDEYYKKGYEKTVPPMLGVCLTGAAYETSDGTFRYGIGSLKDYTQEIPEGFEVLKVPAGLWGKFYTKGALPDAIRKLWCEVSDNWLPSSGYEVIPGFDFECYSEGDLKSDDYVSGIWLCLKEK